MPIVLDHTIVPAYDNEASARFFARIFGLQYEASLSHFAPVRVNDTLVLDFDTRTTFEPHHYAFRRQFFNGSSARASRTAAARGHLTIWRLTTAVEDAGFTLRIRMGICWRY
jgi:hypothetical protein